MSDDSSTSSTSSYDWESHGNKPLSVPDITKMMANMNPSLVDTANDEKTKNLSPPPIQTQSSTETLPQTQFSPKKQYTSDQLANRDQNAVAYTRSQLEEGDTLVYYKSPGTIMHDHTGFALSSKPSRVHSAHLLATGSKVFQSLLQDEWTQHRARKRKGFVNKAALPPGIEYVLNLTPPDEGDEAVEIIAQLSCSRGVCNWYSSEQRCGVHRSLAGGKDEIAKPRGSITGRDKPIAENLLEEWQPSVTFEDPTIAGDEVFGNGLDRRADVDLQNAIRRSQKEHAAAIKASMQFDPDAKQRSLKVEEVKEYCPVRHRAGIERLLQVIEGKDPRLDSAPKVWTLFVLAKRFDCTKAVLDYIVSWMLAEPNSQFIEILPEVSYKIGNGLQSAIIARPAFSILVSEEAMNVASRMTGNFDAVNKRTSRFLRPKEDIDEDSLDAIQAAAHEFESRIQKTFDDLVSVKMDWVSNLREFKKLEAFLRHCREFSLSQTSTEGLIDNVKAFVRGNILSTLTKKLSYVINREANNHRRAENYLEPYNDDFQVLYSSLNPRELVMTKPFWQMVREIWWSVLDRETINSKFGDYGSFENTNNIMNTSMHVIGGLQLSANSDILAAIKDNGFNKGHIPSICYQYQMFDAPDTPYAATRKPFQHDNGTITMEPTLIRRPDVGRNNEQVISPSVRGATTTTSHGIIHPATDQPPTYKESDGQMSKPAFRGNTKENEKPSNPDSPTYLYSLAGQQPDTVHSWEQIASSEFAESKRSNPLGWKRLVDNVKANFGRHGWYVPTHPFESDEEYFEYLAHIETKLFEDGAKKRVKYTQSDASSMDVLYDNIPYRTKHFEDEESEKEPLLQKEPKHYTTLENSGQNNSQSPKVKGQSYPYSTGVDSAPDSGSSFDEKLQANFNSHSGKVVLSPVTVVQQKSETTGTFGRVKRVLSGSNLPSISRPVGEMTTNQDRVASGGIYSIMRAFNGFEDGALSPTTKIEVTKRRAIVPKEVDIGHESPFFSISNFLAEVNGYVKKITCKMLSNNECDFSVLTDTLLCLEENEYKYLPLWAGGNEDGSGGVYDPEMPPAHLGPNGPGPAYHTGFSSDSRASTEIDWDGRSSVDTSIAVENGHLSHIDRRFVKSVDGSGTSIAFSDDSEIYGPSDIKGKGKAVDNPTPTTSTAPSIIDDDDFMDVSDEELELSESEEEWDDSVFT